MRTRLLIALALVSIIAAPWPAGRLLAARPNPDMSQIVGQVIRPLMAVNDIPGIAVGIVVNGQSKVFDYGYGWTKPNRAVTRNTLFEIGSISKTFTATLAAYAQLQGDLSLDDMVGADLPVLRCSALDEVSLVDLGTHTPGGMPLQVPDGINDMAQLAKYFEAWKPAYAPGTVRTYSNVSIGLLGVVTAARMRGNFSTLLERQMFPALGLAHTFVNVPSDELVNYAQGHEDDGTAIRMAPGVLAPETYGIRTTAADLLRYLAINMQLVRVDDRWQRAVKATHTGYDGLRAGGMIQDLAWEQYDLPVALAALQAGNSVQMLLNPNPVIAFNPPLPPRPDVLINKSGSTNGFAAYVAFVPAKRIGIVLLANKSYPIPARVAAAYAILAQLGANR